MYLIITVNILIVKNGTCNYGKFIGIVMGLLRFFVYVQSFKTMF